MFPLIYSGMETGIFQAKESEKKKKKETKPLKSPHRITI